MLTQILATLFILVCFGVTGICQPQVLASFPLISGDQNLSEQVIAVDVVTDLNANTIVLGKFNNIVRSPFFFSKYNGTHDYFLVKYSTSGQVIWKVQIDNLFRNNASLGIDADSFGNIFLFGTDQGNKARIDKFNPSGTILWSKTITGLSYSEARGFDVDASGNISFIVNRGGTVYLDPPANTQALTGQGEFVARYDSDGIFIGVIDFPTAPGNLCSPRNVSINSTGFIISGYFIGTVDFDPGAGALTRTAAENTGFIAAYTSIGALLWVNQLSSNAASSIAEVKAQIVDQDGNVIVHGNLSGSVDFDPSASTQLINVPSGVGLYIAKYASNGSLSFAFALATNSHANSGATDLAVDVSGNIYATGAFFGVTDFDPSSATFNLSPLQYLGSSLATQYICRYSPGGGLDWAQRLDWDPPIRLHASTNQELVVTSNFYNTQKVSMIKTVRFNQPPTIESFSPSSGPIGTLVTVTGSNFSPIPSNNIVSFIGVQAIVQAATAKEMVVSVPGGAGSGNISIGVGGVIVPSTQAFNVITPTFTSASSLLYGSSITLTINAGGSTGAVSFSVSNGTGSATLNGNVLTPTSAGFVTVNATIAASGPYPVINLSQVISIQKAPQSIPSWATSANCDLFPLTLSPTSSAGLPLQYSSSNTSVATVSGNVVNFVGPGTTTIYASQSGNQNYYSTGYSQSISIQKSNQAVSINVPSDPILKRFGDSPFTLSASASSGLPITWSDAYDVANISPAGLVTVLNAGQATIQANQAGNACYNPAWAQKSLVVQKAAQQMSFSVPTGNYCGESPVVTVSSNSTNPVSVNVLNMSGVDPYYVSLGNNSFKFIQSGVFSFSQSSSRNFEAASSSSFQVTVDPYPAGFLSTSDPIVFCTPGNIATQLNLTLQSDGVHYINWLKDGYDIAFAGGTNYNANQPGVYTARIARNTPSGCTIVTDPITVSVLNCNNFVLSPNPASQIVTLTLPAALGYGTQARIFDPYQGVVASTWLQPNQTTATFNTENLPDGIYQVQVDLLGNTLSRNLSIVH